MRNMFARLMRVLFISLLWAGGSGVAFANFPVNISTSHTICNLPANTTLPNLSGEFICADADYSGNAGKNWNELDLVPLRIKLTATNSAPATQTYTLAVVVDREDVGRPGFDVLSAPKLNVAKSDTGCNAASSGSELLLAPGSGGTDVQLYRLVTFTQAKGKACTYDYYARLALGAHLYPGSSLHANVLREDFSSAGGVQDRSIPVKAIKPQELRKDMSATADSDVQWNILKSANPASINFGNVCAAPDGPLSKQVTFRVEWVKVGTTPGGVTFITNIYAKNPASRTITVDVTDKVYKGTGQAESDLLDTAVSGPVDVIANTEKLVLTHTKTITDGSAGVQGAYLNDVATATYTDKVTNVLVPGTTTATASAQIGVGVLANNFAAIGDSESISGTGLTFSVAQPLIGTFAGYTAGTPTIGPVDWGITGETTGRYVDFVKTIYLDAHRATSGSLIDTAVLLASPGGFTNKAGPVVVTIESSATVKLTVTKAIPLTSANNINTDERIEVKFTITGTAATNYSDTRTLSFGPGETFKSVDVIGLAPDTYTVNEDSALFYSSPTAVGIDAGLQPIGGPQKQVDLTAGADGIFSAAECAGTAAYTNAPSGGPIVAQVKKITQPVLAADDPDINWTFTLTGPGLAGGVTKTVKAGDDFALGEFGAVLEQDGTYYVTETTKPNPPWVLISATPEGEVADKVCSFVVKAFVDQGKIFQCSFTNQKQGKAKVVKTVLGVAPSGAQTFTFQLRKDATTTSNGTTLESANASATTGGTISFATYLVPGSQYQLCEIVMPGWLTSLGTFVPDSFMPPDGVATNPNVDNSILCLNFTVAAGETKSFTVDNTPPPGGRALTIGFWKNWASCANSGGKQKPVLDQTLALAELGGEVISAGTGEYPAFGPTFYLVLHGSTVTPDAAPDCLKAVRLLNKSTTDAGKKMASDPAFNLAAQLVAAELNYTAGAGRTGAATTAINQAVRLLGKYLFDGKTHTTISAADSATMNSAAKTLDDYNNNR